MLIWFQTKGIYQTRLIVPLLLLFHTSEEQEIDLDRRESRSDGLKQERGTAGGNMRPLLYLGGWGGLSRCMYF